jgi:hypothetical protein
VLVWRAASADSRLWVWPAVVEAAGVAVLAAGLRLVRGRQRRRLTSWRRERPRMVAVGWCEVWMVRREKVRIDHVMCACGGTAVPPAAGDFLLC